LEANKREKTTGEIPVLTTPRKGIKTKY